MMRVPLCLCIYIHTKYLFFNKKLEPLYKHTFSMNDRLWTSGCYRFFFVFINFCVIFVYCWLINLRTKKNNSYLSSLVINRMSKDETNLLNFFFFQQWMKHDNTWNTYVHSFTYQYNKKRQGNIKACVVRVKKNFQTIMQFTHTSKDF